MSDQQKQPYKFEFSLNVKLFRTRIVQNFGTVIAEAVANAWDAEATEVRLN